MIKYSHAVFINLQGDEFKYFLVKRHMHVASI